MAINVVNTNKQVIMLDVVSLLYSSINVTPKVVIIPLIIFMQLKSGKYNEMRV